MSIVLITGSSGLVGSESVNFFSKKGFDVVGIDNNLRKFFFGKDASTNQIKQDLIKRNKRFKILVQISEIIMVQRKFIKDIKKVFH